ncbi:hypothetical protein GOP47_0003097 [Adiantum capillus-veneris]|uniref:NAD(P)H dehydrogenase (quinone) n=1 Tax=Adiantum capillus-veneris TaxID=13818 RepID=A0A9D4VBK4_ADICA|nr:hypothetical protein GOP47_0003097 [Adiantum capillus-veneris]
MGKGKGCVPSKHKPPAGAPATGSSPPLSPNTTHSDGGRTREPPSQDVSAPAGVQLSSKNLKIFIVYYSMYGHVEALAKKIKEGVDSVDGVEGYLCRVAETLTPDVLEKMRAPPKDENIPTISAHELPAADGVIFGFPTRYGAMAAQMKAFFDSTGSLWRRQELAGKPAGLFVSTGTQGGGQETTAWTAITQLAHHGMLFVPIGYTFGAGMFKLDEIRGGSPYGAGTFAGDGTRLPTDTELALAEHQGKYTAGVVQRLLRH